MTRHDARDIAIRAGPDVDDDFSMIGQDSDLRCQRELESKLAQLAKPTKYL